MDLPDDLQRELKQLDARGDSVSHYELLAVGAGADGADIRRAYLARSKRFHPDSWYRKEVGPFAPLLSKMFQRLSAAYQVLSDEDARDRYDRDNKDTFTDADRVAIERRAEHRKDEERRASENRRRLLSSKGFARIGAGRRLFEEGLALAEAGDRSQAIQTLKAARELDPNRKEIIAKLLELEKEAARSRAISALSSAQEREKSGRLEQAAAAYVSAFQADPSSAAAAAGAARCTFATGDARAASTWAARAVEIMPADLDMRMLHARACIELKLKVKARAELQFILGKDPGNKEAKALLKSI